MPHIDNLIYNFSQKNLTQYLRSKINTFKPDDEDLSYLFKEELFEKYISIEKLGEATIGGDDLIIIASKTTDGLTEKSGKKIQFEIAKKILKEELKDAALFVFYDDEGNFRFSFVKANYLGTKKSYTDFKRYSYFVTPIKANNTFKRQVDGCNFSTLDEIINAFSVEPLNKLFYQEVSKAFYELIGGKINIASKKYDFKAVLELPSTPLTNRKIYQEFSVRLIGRTIFCWFLKNKKSDAKKPLIPENWLSSDTVDLLSNGGYNYYHDYLEKLFFLILNKKQDERIGYDLPEGNETIPFLNGGLFEPHPYDFFARDSNGIHKISYNLKIPNEWFFKFFKVLEQFNFTIDENSINDAEVSIDPEMLGTIFENLLAEIDPDTAQSARKATGSFYTPREIVDYMVEQSIIQYLKTKTNVGNEGALQNLFKEGGENEFNEEQTEEILEALNTIKILDPACGSGAFPMGALHKIITILHKLDPDASWWKEKQIKNIPNALARKYMQEKLDTASADYIRKLGVIQNSIYGVDIQPIATEIAKLRSFLSLIIDENIIDDAKNRGIEPLPNLEFKFVTANTLIGLPDDGGQQGMFDNFGELQLLEQLRSEYLQSSGEKKNELKERFLSLQNKTFKNQHNLFADTNSRSYKLMSWNPFNDEPSAWFDTKWMFGVEKFDIIFGNPPYRIVKSKNTDNKILDNYKLFYTADFKINLFALFFEKSIKNAVQKGIVSLIIPDSSINLPAFTLLRKFLFENSSVKTISYFNENIFDNATVGKSVIINVQVGTEPQDFDFIKFDSFTEYKKEKINIEIVKNDDEYKYNITSGNQDEINLINKLKNIKTNVDSFYNVFDGINPGSDFIKNEFISKTYIDSDSKKVIDGKNFEKYSTINWDYSYIYYSSKKVEQVRQNLNKKGLDFTARIIKKNNFFESLKIVTRQTSDTIIGTLDKEKFYVKNSVHSTLLKKEFKFVLNLNYLLAIYNSKLINWYYKNISLEDGRVFPQVKISSLKKLPVILPNSNILNKITIIVDELLTQKIFEKIDKLDIIIFKLFGLTFNEVLLIDPDFNLSEEEYENFTIE